MHSSRVHTTHLLTVSHSAGGGGVRQTPPGCRPPWSCDLWCMLGNQPPLVNRITDRCKNITLSQTSVTTELQSLVWLSILGFLTCTQWITHIHLWYNWFKGQMVGKHTPFTHIPSDLVSVVGHWLELLGWPFAPWAHSVRHLPTLGDHHVRWFPLPTYFLKYLICLAQKTNLEETLITESKWNGYIMMKCCYSQYNRLNWWSSLW